MSNFQMIVNESQKEKLLIPAAVKVAFINGPSSKAKCGIYQHGLSVWKLLSDYQYRIFEFNFCYEAISCWEELIKFDLSQKPDIYIFNGNAGTMPWLTSMNLYKLSAVKILFTHDIENYDAVFFSPGKYDFLMTDDLTVEITNPYVLKVGRLIHEGDIHQKRHTVEPVKLKVGSFGLALPEKGFGEIIEKFCNIGMSIEFNFHMPKSDYMDPDGMIQKKLIDECRVKLTDRDCSLNITTDFMDKSQLIDFLSSNDLNIFNYQLGRGNKNQVSGITEYALGARRPFFVSKCAMFRNITNVSPHYFDLDLLDIRSNIKEAFHKNMIAQEYIRSEWTDSGFLFDMHSSLTYAIQNKYNSRKPIRNLKNFLKNKIRSSFYKNKYTHLENSISLKNGDQDIPNLIQFPNNSILDHERDGEALISIIEDIKKTCNRSVLSKVPVSLVQHAYVANNIMTSFKPISMPKIACLGAYGDILSEYLKKKGYVVFDIDPNLNYTVEEYLQRNPNHIGTFDLCFSVSVLEHVQDDEGFIAGAMTLLKHGGKMVNTVDFRTGNEIYIPPTHIRFYDADLLKRIYETYNNSLDNSPNDWDGGSNNFHYNNTSYTFATLLINK